MALITNTSLVIHANNDLLDSSGNGNNGTAYGALFSTDSKLGSHAAIFDGIDDRVEFADATSLDIDGDMSAGAWVKTTNIQREYQCILGKGSTSQNFGFYIRDSRVHFQFYSGGWRTHVSPTGAIANNTYYRVLVTLDTVADVIKLYKDNVEIYSAAEANTPVVEAGVARIGGDGGSSWFIGKSDEVVLWKNRVLSVADIAEDWNGGAGIEIGVESIILNPFVPKVIQTVRTQKTIQTDSKPKVIQTRNLYKAVKT